MALVIIEEVIDIFKEMRSAYNRGDHDFRSWCEVPLLIIEDSNNSYISDPVILERVFDSVRYCKEYLDLPTIDFQVQHLIMAADSVAIATVFWDFFNEHKKNELALEIGYIVQKKETRWKIISMLQPTWRNGAHSEKDITKIQRHE